MKYTCLNCKWAGEENELNCELVGNDFYSFEICPNCGCGVCRKAAVYIASRFSRRHECNALAQILKMNGFSISCRWILPNESHVLPVGISDQAADKERERFALEDLEDLTNATWCISLTEEPRNNSRGGRHVEFGIAIALQHKLTVIGPRETVFHHLPNVEHFDTVEDFLKGIEND